MTVVFINQANPSVKVIVALNDESVITSVTTSTGVSAEDLGFKYKVGDSLSNYDVSSWGINILISEVIQ